MRLRSSLFSISALACLLLSTAVFAQQGIPSNTMLNTVQISASVSDAIAQDKATLRLFVERKNTDPNRLADEVNGILAQATAEAKKETRVKASSGSYRTWPVTTSKASVIDAWQTRAELVLESQNFSALSDLSKKLMLLGMEMGSMQFSLSPETQFNAEKKLTQTAVTAFREKARMTTQLFGFGQYDIVDINVYANSPMPYTLAQQDAMPVMPAGGVARKQEMPMAAGDSTVTVTISGKIRMK